MYVFFFFNDTATTEIYTLSLHDALPISRYLRAVLYQVSPTDPVAFAAMAGLLFGVALAASYVPARRAARSEEHTSELQSQSNLVCRLLLEKKKRPYGHNSRCRRSVLQNA